MGRPGEGAAKVECHPACPGLKDEGTPSGFGLIELHNAVRAHEKTLSGGPAMKA